MPRRYVAAVFRISFQKDYRPSLMDCYNNKNLSPQDKEVASVNIVLDTIGYAFNQGSGVRVLSDFTFNTFQEVWKAVRDLAYTDSSNFVLEYERINANQIEIFSYGIMEKNGSIYQRTCTPSIIFSHQENKSPDINLPQSTHTVSVHKWVAETLLRLNTRSGGFFSRVGNFMAKYPGTSAFLIGLALVGAGIGLWYLLPVALAAAGFGMAAASILPAASIFSAVGSAIASVFGATTLSSAVALGLGTAATAFAGGLGLGVVIGIGELFITPKNSDVLSAQDNPPSVEGRKRKNGKEKAIDEETQLPASQNNDSKPVDPAIEPNNGETSSRQSGNGSKFFPPAQQQSNDGYKGSSDTSPEKSAFGDEPESSSSLGSPR